MKEQELIRKEILKKVVEFYQAGLKPSGTEIDKMIPFAGRVFDQKELVNLVDSSLDFWLTAGRYAEQFEGEFAVFMDVAHCLLVNSGSSANLVALTALTSPQLGEKRLRKNDEVITVAAGFPTTINPIIQNGLIPVFVDVELATYNVKVEELKQALSDKTKAIMLAHTLGNPFNLDAVLEFADKYDLYLIEDCCDAVGSTYRGKKVGAFGHLSTVSFYPAHHMTMGEGGAVLTNDQRLRRIATSVRDWGRDCYCVPGADNTCGRRFTRQQGGLPLGYDHKYVYSHIGYNLKVTEMQAAIGTAQLKKLPSFIKKRKENFVRIEELLLPYEEYLILPAATKNSAPAWFGFPITVKENDKFTRNDLIKYLEDQQIMTRLLFAGNITKQPAYLNLDCRIIGDLKNTDYIMNNTFFIGVYPGISAAQIEYIGETFIKFFARLSG